MLIELLNDKVVGHNTKFDFQQYKYSLIFSIQIFSNILNTNILLILDKDVKHHANTAKATRQKVQQGNRIQSYGDNVTESPAGL